MANGNGIATSDMKHNGLRKRLDVLGFSQPLPLGAVPLVGAILEDLIQTTESLKQHKDQVHKLLQEKNAWDLGVEAYKCDNSKLLAQVSALNKQLIQQKDQFEAKKLESSRRLRNLEMDKRYLEEHLQQMGERFEELEGKYQDVLDPKRKSSRKPFVSTVKSGCLIPPATSSNTHHLHQPLTLCPLRCPASARRKDVEVERDRLQQDTVSLQESIDMQSQQASVLVYFLKTVVSLGRIFCFFADLRKFPLSRLICGYPRSLLGPLDPPFILYYSNIDCDREECIFFILCPLIDPKTATEPFSRVSVSSIHSVLVPQSTVIQSTLSIHTSCVQIHHSSNRPVM